MSRADPGIKNKGGRGRYRYLLIYTIMNGWSRKTGSHGYTLLRVIMLIDIKYQKKKA